ncbi:glycosyltransferase [Paludibacterium denitrificans]|uniref:glycosyltransferase n=1 Tax=Paludibacterium denitrificans TaxID=2675226 RepID=UPI001E3D6708|nr:glycosyltransferase [Paludibacterium denitrificans]
MWSLPRPPIRSIPSRPPSSLSKTGARLVYEVHDLWPLTPVEVGGMSPKHPFIRLLQWAEDFGYKKADTVISMLPCAKDYMMAHGMAAEKYHVIPNGVDVDEWQGASQPLPAAHVQRLAELKADKRFLIGYVKRSWSGQCARFPVAGGRAATGAAGDVCAGG